MNNDRPRSKYLTIRCNTAPARGKDRLWKFPQMDPSPNSLTRSARQSARGTFLLHVLPNGFMRIRHFGFLANRAKKHALPQCRKLLGLNPALPQIPQRSAQELLRELTGIDLVLCPRCQKGTMIVVGELPRISCSAPWDSS